MTQPIRTFYIDSQPVDLSTLAASSQSPRDQIEAFEKDSLSRADHQPLHKQGTYKNQVRAFVNDLRAQLERMRALNLDTLQICSEMRSHIEKYNLALNALYTHSGEYERGKEGSLAHNAALASQIRGTSFQFTSFTPSSKSTPLSRRQVLAKDLQEMDMRDHLLDVQVAGNLVKATGEAVVGAAKAACSVTETSKQACKSTLDLAGKAGKAVLDATGTKEIVKQAIGYLQTCEGTTLAEVLVEQYGYAPEEAKEIAKQYVKNVGVLATATVGYGAQSLALKGVKQLLQKGGAAEASAAASPVVEKTAKAAPSRLPQVPLNVVLSRDDVTILSPPPPAYFKSRIITERTKIVPEDIGMNSTLFTEKFYVLDGWMTRGTNATFKIEVDLLFVTKGRLSNILTVMDHFKEIAKTNQASILQLNTLIINDDLLRVLTKRYGNPSIELKTGYNEQIKYQVFKIPINN